MRALVLLAAFLLIPATTASALVPRPVLPTHACASIGTTPCADWSRLDLGYTGGMDPLVVLNDSASYEAFWAYHFWPGTVPREVDFEREFVAVVSITWFGPATIEIVDILAPAPDHYAIATVRTVLFWDAAAFVTAFDAAVIERTGDGAPQVAFV